MKSKEKNYFKLGDKRNNRRMEVLLDDLVKKPNNSIPSACSTKAKTKAAYRLLESDRIKTSDILLGVYRETQDQMDAEEIILVSEDSSSLNYGGLKKTKGLGAIERRGLGIKMHSSMAISKEGVPLGIISQEYWVRTEKGKTKRRYNKKTSEKESNRWLSTLKDVEGRIGKEKQIVMITDRESDIYDYFIQEKEERTKILLRAYQNRQVNGHPNLLFDHIESKEIQGYIDITVGRQREKKERKAKLSIRYGEVELYPPRSRSKEKRSTKKITAILVKEVEVPTGEKTLSWLLLTNLEVQNIEDAKKAIKWYSYRWLIERYHYTLKSGCQVEELQLEEESRLEKAVAVYSIVASRILNLTYFSRKENDESCDIIFDRDEWEALYCFQNKTKNPIDKPPTIKEFVKMVAVLGGFLNRKSDGNPGVKVIWRGIKKLYYITETYKIFKNCG